VRKAVLTPWLVAAAFLFSAWLNVVHGYEHDDHEQHTEECGICVLLSSITDHVIDDSNLNVDHFQLEKRYSFIAKNNLSIATYFTNPRAPPYTQNII